MAVAGQGAKGASRNRTHHEQEKKKTSGQGDSDPSGPLAGAQGIMMLALKFEGWAWFQTRGVEVDARFITGFPSLERLGVSVTMTVLRCVV